MRKKFIFIIFSILLVTGCTNEYNITISNDKIEEQIVATIPDTDIPVQSQEEIDAGIELDDRITPFIENDQYPFDNENEKYNKEVHKEGNTTIVKLDYDYTHDQFRASKTYNNCFENRNFVENKDNYVLNLNGSFYCLYGDELVINIKTNNEVISNNADRVSGNTYTWVINKDNVQDVNISMEISKTSKWVKNIMIIVAVIAGAVIIIGGYIAYKKIKNRDNVNEI